MNRKQRRLMMRKTKGKILPFNEGEEDHSKDLFCWRHPNIPIHPKTPIKELDKVRFQPYKVINKDGSIEFARKCPKCGQIIHSKPQIFHNEDLIGLS